MMDVSVPNDASAPNDAITISVPVWISKNSDEDDYLAWLRGQLKTAGSGRKPVAVNEGPVAISMRIAALATARWLVPAQADGVEGG